MYKVKKDKSGSKLLVRLEQNNMRYMNNVVQKFTMPENLVMNACAGTFHVTKACTLFPKYRSFTACKDPICKNEAMPHMILLYAQQVLSTESDIEREEHVCSSVEVHVKAIEASEVRKRLDVLEVPEQLLPMQTCRAYILYQLSMYFGREELFQKAKKIPVNQRGRNRRARLNM